MANDNSRKFKQNQKITVSYTHLDVYKRQVYECNGYNNNFHHCFIFDNGLRSCNSWDPPQT